MNRKLYMLVLLLVGTLSLQMKAQTVVTIQDGDLVGNTTYDWTNDNVYLLDGFVYLEAGGVLNIEPGTVIKAKNEPSNDDRTSALIITRGAKIFANGTANAPIIFTAEADDPAVGDDIPTPQLVRGLWGGLIVLGNASLAFSAEESGIEGIDASEERAKFGGTNDADTSGVIRYVSIRHGGDELAPGDEINGLTLGGVGSGTVVEYVEVFANLDDGIELFGGTVDVKWASVSFCGDDSFDWDFGWRGRGQFWFSLNGSDVSGRGGEHDGASPDGQDPFSQPTIYNATYIGSGVDATPGNEGNDFALFMRDRTGGFYHNSIITDFPQFGLAIEDRDGDADAYNNFVNGDLKFVNNLWFGFGNGNEVAQFVTLSNDDTPLDDDKDLVATLAADGNQAVDPSLGGISRNTDGGLDPRPNGDSPALAENDNVPTDNYFTPVSYRGAFGNGSNWAIGWTALDINGFFGDLATPIEPGQITITDADLQAGMTYDWTADNVYTLDGFVYLEEGGVLNIEPGTIIKAKNQPTNGDRTSALIITRGAQIFANGTANAPIIFTAEADDPNDGDDIPNAQLVRGLWGGIIILGDATLAFSAEESGIEGIDASEERAKFGGTNDEDNSGVLRYVSIRHGGDELAPGDEINGLTLGGVGSGTIIEYVEVFANLDDGIELFGGTVDVKWASVSFCGDDSFDWDFGWRGRGQFWFSMNGSDVSGRGGEHDGASPDGQDPFSQPTIYNATYIGSGIDASPGNEGNDFALFMRDRTGGFYHNSIITDFPQYGLAIEDRDGDGDAYNNFVNGDLRFVNNLWFAFGNGNEVADFVTLSNDDTPLDDDKDLVATLAADGNQAIDPSLGGISRIPDGGLDPRPNGDSPALADNDNLPTDDFFTSVSYRGAFSNGANWMLDWTALSTNGFFGDLATPKEPGQITITDADLQGGQTHNWTADNIYTLDGFVYLEEGGVLNIEAGTIIKAKNQPTTGDRTSALVITRGAQIFANGTQDQPIIFTAEADDPTLGFDVPSPQLVRGLWGGIIILGKATLAFSAEESGIEGIDASEERAKFGGTSDADNSGVLRYISIRHGGDELAPGDEINGLTLGGVGSGTIIEHVEVFANLDDGIELFGGTVDVKWAAVSFCGDDSFDWDFGWRGRGQYWFSLNGDDVSGRGGEHDGASPDGQDPFSQPTIYNATYIGSGIDATPGNEGNDFALFMRDRTGGVYANSIITDFPQYGLAIEDRDGDGDAYNNFVTDNLQFLDNIWFGFGNGNDPAQFATLSNDDTPLDDDKDLVATLIADGNQAVDPMIAGITRVPSAEGTPGELDPRPNSGPASFGAPNSAPNDGFFNRETFFGAFSPERELWLTGWTALDNNNFLGNIVVGLDDVQDEEEGYILDAPAPTPSFDLATVSFELPQAAKVNMHVYDLSGRMVQRVKADEFLFEGTHQTTINVSQLPNGTYFVVMQAAGVQLVQKMLVSK